MANHYESLLAVSGSLGAYGKIIKILGVLLAAVAVVCALVVGHRFEIPIDLPIAVAGIFFGIVLHATGTVIAAMGEGLLALADIATNTGRLP